MAKRMQSKILDGVVKFPVDSVETIETKLNDFLATLEPDQFHSLEMVPSEQIRGGLTVCVLYLTDVPKKADVAG